MRVSLLIGALAVAMMAVAGCSNTPAPAPAPAPTPAPSAGKTPAQGVRGQITAETATSWTVANAKGKAFTVTISPQTAFGTKAAPATAAQFPVGTTVRVIGTRSGSTVTATRIALAKTNTAPSATPAPATGTPPA